MKNIFEGQVLNALPIAGGIVFAYVEKITKIINVKLHINT